MVTDADKPDNAPTKDMPEPEAETSVQETAEAENMDTLAEPSPVPRAPERHIYVQKAGAGTMALGGIAAAAIGFGAAQYSTNSWPFGPGVQQDESLRVELMAKVDEQDAQLAELTKALEGAGNQGAIDAVTASVEALKGDLSSARGAVDAVTGQVADLASRLTELEKRPISEGVSPEAIAAYEEELRKLQQSVTDQRAEIEAMAADAAKMEQNANETARKTLARSTVTRILTALDAGDPFDGLLTELEGTGTDVPEVLRIVAADGVATRTQLEEAFPEAARKALIAARKAGDDAGGTGLADFLKNQLGARSVTPREGTDPDAVLSRTEAAVKEGRLADAMAEIDTLPDGSKAELSDWIASAQERLDALDAAESLMQRLDQE